MNVSVLLDAMAPHASRLTYSNTEFTFYDDEKLSKQSVCETAHNKVTVF